MKYIMKKILLKHQNTEYFLKMIKKHKNSYYYKNNKYLE